MALICRVGGALGRNEDDQLQLNRKSSASAQKIRQFASKKTANREMNMSFVFAVPDVVEVAAPLVR
jgi:hypothetical protein